MHTACFEVFEKAYSQARGHGHRPFFLCPLCKSFGDVLIPVVSTKLKKIDPSKEVDTADDFKTWLTLLPTSFLESRTSLDMEWEVEDPVRRNSGVFSISRMKSFLSKLASSPPPSSPISMAMSISPPRGSYLLSSSLSSRSRSSSMDEEPSGSSSLSHRATSPVTRRQPSLSPANAVVMGKLEARLEQVYLPAEKSKAQTVYHLLDSYTYSLKTAEIALRGRAHKVASDFFFESVPKQDRLFISAFSNLIEASALATENSRAMVKQIAWNLLRKIVWCVASEEDFQELYQDMVSAKGVVLLEDSFANLVRLLCLSHMTSAFDALHFVRLFFLVEVIKVTLGLMVTDLLPVLTREQAEATVQNPEDRFFLALASFVKQVWSSFRSHTLNAVFESHLFLHLFFQLCSMPFVWTHTLPFPMQPWGRLNSKSGCCHSCGRPPC